MLIKSISNQYVENGNQSFYLEKYKSLHFHIHLFVIFACVCLRDYVHKQLTIGGSMSELAAGQMASPSPQRTVGVRGGHEEAGKRALSHTAQISELHLSAGRGD